MSGSETILVVEDADEIRRLVCGVLVLQGYNCLAAADGVDALQRIESSAEPVHLVLTDMVMPKMMGSEYGTACCPTASSDAYSVDVRVFRRSAGSSVRARARNFYCEAIYRGRTLR